MRVEVWLQSERPLRGADVRFKRHDVGANVDYATDSNGVAEASLGPGSWDVDVTLAGFRPAHYPLALPPGQACTLRFHLWIDETAGFF